MNGLKDMVKDGKKVYFQFYRSGKLYYKTECGFMFEVPISDAGDACFNAEEKAILLMRWLRKAVSDIQTNKE